jgi:hypothetical protein
MVLADKMDGLIRCLEIIVFYSRNVTLLIRSSILTARTIFRCLEIIVYYSRDATPLIVLAVKMDDLIRRVTFLE